MDNVLGHAALCHARAERMRARALKEMDEERRRVMLSISELYYLLHDQLLKLEQVSLASASRQCGSTV